MRRKIEMIGRIFGKLTVIRPARPNKKHTRIRLQWLCKCECGTTCTISGENLRRENTQSCGCIAKQNGLTHGKSNSIEYKTWAGMKDRCYNLNAKNYKFYGGRGIAVCESWLDSFENFLKDMGEKPANFTIERINNNGNYSPSNCKWATMKEQCQNKRGVRNIELNGMIKTISGWAEYSGVGRRTIGRRLNVGIGLEEIIKARA